jgi:hypothetical protein
MMVVALCATIWSHRQATIPRVAYAGMLPKMFVIATPWNETKRRLE